MSKAINILHAAEAAFFSANQDKDYSTRKANAFLSRCGAKFELGPEQEIDDKIVKQVVFSMLDADTEKVFWACLKRSQAGHFGDRSLL